MHPTKRRDIILKAVQEEGKVEINEMSDELKVSAMTIRRDLVQLEEDGKLIRTHGGAVLPKPLITETPFSTKQSRQTEQKKLIAKKTLPLIKAGHTIILDSGTTTLELARLLVTRDDITVITNDIKIAAELSDSQLKVFVTGGELQNNIGALYGPQTHQFLKNIHVDMFFLGAHALDLKAGITSPTFEKSLMKQLMIEAAEATWLVADSSKFEQKAFSKVCDFDHLSGFITDENVSDEVKEQLFHYINII
ncbi:DeoR family regulatory proteins [Lentibacillus kapialis]|uniref:DeoR family regulatory proteins n=1 Tax=Lentibacillus kapialis TaxID=340214 RepID=A0A917PTM4_9BACI|nr:DeoR/GlpR family DNA-binding transcription regulator [Lentibacillus kapialis]GGJ91348.1 DeoR family regulatory proteins [Lentibacillus kapialis]